MAIEIVVAHATATTVAIPAHQAGDLLIISAVKWASSSPTPTVPSGWTSAHARTTTYRGAVGYRYAAGPGTTSGTWTEAADLWVIVVRGATIGAVTSAASVGDVATPALTLSSPPSVVLSLGTAAGSGAAGTPEGMTSVWESSGTYRSKVSVTPAPVSSWSSVAGSNQDTSVIIELIPSGPTLGPEVTLPVRRQARVAGPEVTLPVRRQARVAGPAVTLPVRRQAEGVQLIVTLPVRRQARVAGPAVTLPVRRKARVAGPAVTLPVRRKARALGPLTTMSVRRQARALGPEVTVPIRRKADAFGGWAEIVGTAMWEELVASRDRLLGSRAELVDIQGRPVPITVDGVDTYTLPLKAASVEYHGTQARERWRATMSFTSPWLIPKHHDHPFGGTSNLRIRLWWRIWHETTWLEVPVCTVVPLDPSVTKTRLGGAIEGTIEGRDVLSTARGGYGAPLDVSGLTLDDVIRAVFARIAPTLPLRVADTTMTAPAVCILGERDPMDDLRDFAAQAWPGGEIATDREGIIVAGPRPEPMGPVLDWQESDDSPVAQINWALKTSAMGNQITVRSTHTDAVGVYATVQDDDPSSPTSVEAWGAHPLPTIETDTTDQVDGCRNLALMHLGHGLHPTEDVEAEVPQRGDLVYQRPAQLADADLGLAGLHRISSWSLVLPDGVSPPPRMTVRMMQRTVIW